MELLRLQDLCDNTYALISALRLGYCTHGKRYNICYYCRKAIEHKLREVRSEHHHDQQGENPTGGGELS